MSILKNSPTGRFAGSSNKPGWSSWSLYKTKGAPAFGSFGFPEQFTRPDPFLFMKNEYLGLFLLIGCMLSASSATAFNGNDILGVWLNEEKDARIEIYRCDNLYCGRVIWISKPFYAPEEKQGRAGQQRLDDKNPDPELRKRPIVGLRIMSGFSFDGTKWAGGKLYDPKSGKTYTGKMVLRNRDELRMRGYVMFSLLGRTTVWTRSSISSP